MTHFEKYSKVWIEQNKPGLYMNPVGALHKVLVYFQGCWMEKFVELSNISLRNKDISSIIFEDRINTIKFERIE